MYNIKVSNKQIQIIQEALDLYSRLGMGQVDELISPFSGPLQIYHEDHEEAKVYCEGLKRLAFPGLSTNAYYGIFGEKTAEDSKISYDLIQVMRNVVAWHQNPEGGMGVNFDKPLAASDEALCEVEYDTNKKR